MSLMLQPLRRYADFQGRATRSEYWLFQLFLWLVFLAFVLIAALVGSIAPDPLPDAVAALLSVALLFLLAGLVVPSMAVLVRRLHDSGNSGFWAFLALIPIGGLVLFVLSLIPGTRGPNPHGPDPRAEAGA